MMAVPLWLLYEVGIVLAGFISQKEAPVSAADIAD